MPTRLVTASLALGLSSLLACDDTTRPSGEELPLDRCADWCEARTVEHDGGLCAPTSRALPEGSCASVCSAVLEDGADAEAVEDCVREDPLCFLGLDDCARR